MLEWGMALERSALMHELAVREQSTDIQTQDRMILEFLSTHWTYFFDDLLRKINVGNAFEATLVYNLPDFNNAVIRLFLNKNEMPHASLEEIDPIVDPVIAQLFYEALQSAAEYHGMEISIVSRCEE